jgi:dual specificity tyrosine-phosphorylation-regulated kinase 2/3/4
MTEISLRSSLNTLIPLKYILNSKRGSLSIESRRDIDLLKKTSILSKKFNFLPEINSKRASSLDKTSHPIAPFYALQVLGSKLTEFEKKEIMGYSLVYYVGNIENKVICNSAQKNNGYDDNKSCYKVVIGDHISYRYEVLDILGKGSFGQVVKCLDHKVSKLCAIKIVKSKAKFHKQGRLEIKILSYILDSDPNDAVNIIHLRDYFVFRKHLCLKFDILGMNLYELSKFNGHTGFPLGFIRKIAFQIGEALVFLKKLCIIHCDLKPENILILSPSSSRIKVIDLGSACFSDEKMYSYIQSRFYRAPEVILGASYGCSIDIWSLGCILAELYLGYPLFPGENEQEQLSYIIEYIGLPPIDLLSVSYNYSKFFDSEGSFILAANSKNKIRYPGSKSISSKIATSDKKFLNLIECKR